MKLDLSRVLALNLEPRNFFWRPGWQLCKILTSETFPLYSTYAIVLQTYKNIIKITPPYCTIHHYSKLYTLYSEGLSLFLLYTIYFTIFVIQGILSSELMLNLIINFYHVRHNKQDILYRHTCISIQQGD